MYRLTLVNLNIYKRKLEVAAMAAIETAEKKRSFDAVLPWGILAMIVIWTIGIGVIAYQVGLSMGRVTPEIQVVYEPCALPTMNDAPPTEGGGSVENSAPAVPTVPPEPPIAPSKPLEEKGAGSALNPE